MLKNPTPRQMAIYAASLIMLLFFMAYGSMVALIEEQYVVLLSFVMIPVFLFATAYLVVLNIIERFIYRKIKVIYKTIHAHKSAASEEPSWGNDQDVLSEVKKDVAEWAEQNSQEIASLKQLEIYRREYLGNVSHELKTPIFNIQGLIHTLIDGGIHDENINVNYLNRAAKNAERLQTIVEDLETINRFEAGRLILDLRVFDLKELVAEVFEDLEMKAKSKNIKLGFKESATEGWLVKADRETIRQVLINLIDNSIKYGKQGGYTRVGFYDLDQNLLCEVADNGIGISQEHLKHVFDRFFRSDKHRSREAGGSGLGLSIVKHIIEAHRQTINVRSTEGLGSTFGFTLEKEGRGVPVMHRTPAF